MIWIFVWAESGFFRMLILVSKFFCKISRSCVVNSDGVLFTNGFK